ncbi:MAG: hypothetical protein ABSA77_06780 [Thermoguttaceae bacterium]|jgi:hypothetical protein
MSIRRIAQLFVFSVVLVLIVGISASTIHYWINRSEAPISGRILARYEWPESLVELLKDAGQRNIHVTKLVVYSGPHDDYYWKCDATPELLDLMVHRWKLSLVNSNYSVVHLVYEYMPAALSSLKQDKDIDYYVSAEYLPGGEWKGHLYCVMNDKTDNVIVVRYYYNF